MNSKLIFVVLLTSSTTAIAQFSDTYQKAAQAFENAAAQCQSPAGASCLRQNARYYSCLANQLRGGGGCGSSPSCSTSCTSSTSGGGGANLAGIAGIAGGGLSAKQQLALTGLSLALTWINNHHHKDESAPQSADEEAATASQRAANDAATASQRAADEAAMQAAIARADQASSDLANLRAALTSGADPSTLVGMGGQTASDPSVALRNQLSAGGSISDQPAQQVASNDPSDQMANLRAQMTAQAAQQDDNGAAIQDGITNSLKTVEMEGFGQIPAPPAEIDFPTTSAEAKEMGTPQVADNNTGWVESSNPAELQAYRDAPPIQIITFNPDGTSEVKTYPQKAYSQETWPLQATSNSIQPTPQSLPTNAPVPAETRPLSPAPSPIGSISYFSPVPPNNTPMSGDPSQVPTTPAAGCGAWMNCLSGMYNNAKQQAKDSWNGMWTNAKNSYFTGGICSYDNSCGEKK